MSRSANAPLEQKVRNNLKRMWLLLPIIFLFAVPFLIYADSLSLEYQQSKSFYEKKVSSNVSVSERRAILERILQKYQPLEKDGVVDLRWVRVELSLVGAGLTISEDSSLAKPESLKNFKNAKRKGFITDILPVGGFKIAEYAIFPGESTLYEIQGGDKKTDGVFNPKSFIIGMEVKVEGKLDEKTNTIYAEKISIREDAAGRDVSGEAVYEGKISTGANDLLITADGQRLFATTATAHEFKNNDPKKMINVTDGIQEGSLIKFKGKRVDLNQIALEKLEISYPPLSKSFDKLIMQLDKKMKLEFKKAKSVQETGKIKMKVGKNKFELLNDIEISSYIQTLGDKLVPAYLVGSSTGTGRPVLRFHVIRDKAPNAYALPNGIVFVTVPMLLSLENEAQLAFILGHEISHVSQAHIWRQSKEGKTRRTIFAVALTAASIGAAASGADANTFRALNDIGDLLHTIDALISLGYSRKLENQADRLGMEKMFSMGYDPRQAPAVWRMMQERFGRSVKSAWAMHDSEDVRHSYLMAELRRNYKSIDFTALRTDSGQFKKIQEKIRILTAKKK